MIGEKAMKKLNIIFSMLVAGLIFFLSFISFNEGYTFTHMYPLLSQTFDKEMVQFEIQVSSEMLKENTNLAKIIRELYEEIDYDGYIYDDYSDDQEKYADAYISADNYDFPHLSLSNEENLSDSYYITNDFKDENATTYIEQFNRFATDPSSSFMNTKVVYRPMRSLKNNRFIDSNNHILMYFIVPKTEVQSFTEQLKREFITPNFNCSERVTEVPNEMCNMFFGYTSSGEDFIRSKMNFNILENPLSYPKSTIYLTLFSLVLILLNISLTQSKEISIRYLSGNQEMVIFRRLFVQSIVMSIVTFIGTLIVLSLFVLNLKIPITYQYLRNLLSVIFIIILLMMVLSFIFYGLLKYALRKGALKRTFSAQGIMVFSVCIKIIAIILFTIPIAQQYEKAIDEKAYIDYFNEHSFLKDHLIVNHVNYGYEAGWEDQTENNQWLFEIVETLDLQYFNHDELNQYTFLDQNGEILNYVSVNRKFLGNYDIYDTNNQIIDTKALEATTILVPEKRREAFEAFQREITNVIYTKDTPLLSSYMVPGVSIESPNILVVVGDPEHYSNSINFAAISIPNDKEKVDAFIEVVSNRVAPPELNRFNDLYTRVVVDYRDTMISLTLSVVSTILIVSMFSYMIIVTYLENFQKIISVYYTQGYSRFKRFEGLIYVVLGSLLLTYIVSNLQNRLRNPLLGGVINVSTLFWILGIILLIDCILVIGLTHQFEKKSIPSILKGD